MKLKTITPTTTEENNMAGYERIEKYDEATVEQNAKLYKELLTSLGEDPERQGLLKTP